MNIVTRVLSRADAVDERKSLLTGLSPKKSAFFSSRGSPRPSRFDASVEMDIEGGERPGVDFLLRRGGGHFDEFAPDDPDGGENASDQEEHDEAGEQDTPRSREVHPHQVLQNAEEFGLLHADIGDAETLLPLRIGS